MLFSFKTTDFIASSILTKNDNQRVINFRTGYKTNHIDWFFYFLLYFLTLHILLLCCYL